MLSQPDTRNQTQEGRGIRAVYARWKRSVPGTNGISPYLRARWQRITLNVFWCANGLLTAAAAALLLALAVWNAAPWVKYLWLGVFLAVCALLVHGVGYVLARREAERRRQRERSRYEESQ